MSAFNRWLARTSWDRLATLYVRWLLGIAALCTISITYLILTGAFAT